MQAKQKECAGCKQTRHIWKAHGRLKYCRNCWYSMEPPKRIAPVSRKMRTKMDEYTKRRMAFLAIHNHCQAKLVGCTGQATDVHHKAGRGENHLNMSTWAPVCRTCHQWIENNPLEAKDMGLSESRIS